MPTDILQRYLCVTCSQWTVGFEAPIIKQPCDKDCLWLPKPQTTSVHTTEGITVDFQYDSIDTIDEVIAENAEKESIDRAWKEVEENRRLGAEK